jgi:ferrous iron transport protein B
MSTTVAKSTLTIALVGNPNTGKSTLFNALAGVRQRVGNYPGVTVEKKTGHLVHAGQRLELIDLPGTYSLAPRSPDEMVAVDVLLGRRPDAPAPDAVLCIVDASNLERNLYLVSQVLELGLPTVIALNMIDLAADRGMTIDVAALRQRLGVPVIELQANRRQGIEELKQALTTAADRPIEVPASPVPAAFQQEVARLEALLAAAERGSRPPPPRYLVERLLLDTGGYLEEILGGDQALHGELVAARQRLTAAAAPVPAVEAMSRYAWVAQVLQGIVTRPTERKVTLTDRIDRVLTHKVGGTVAFALLMAAVFQTIFVWADLGPMTWINDGFAWLGGQVEASMAEGPLRSLLVDGVIAGVGGVVVFLPQILILFFFMAILEDCGYMARAAYLMDKLMVRVGLSGKSFIPLLSSFACAIPGVMATRVIENRRDRLTTILVAPLMSCSARLPVYTILIAAFIPDRAWLGGVLRLKGLTLFSMYLVGIVAAVAVAWILKKTLLKGPTPPFVMELPTYKMPSPGTVLYRMLDRGWAFVRRAGTLILLVSIAVWAALYYPHDRQAAEADLVQQRQTLTALLADENLSPQRVEYLQSELAHLETDEGLAGAYQRQSYLGRAGRFIEPAVRPLGWDWRIGSAAIASFPAREVVVATLGIIYNLGGEVDESSPDLQNALRNATWEGSHEPVFNIPVALSIMVFFALCAQCASTLVIIKRETNSWRWPAFTFAYMTALAYVAALATYQIGSRIG